MPIFDLHCDTLYECLKQGKKLKTNDLDLSFDRFARIRQVLSGARDVERLQTGRRQGV